VDESTPEDLRSLVVAFLEAGAHTRWAAGLSFCRICGQANGNGERTDGHYVWPEGLAHYVAQHNVRLPDLVEQHALAWAEPTSWQIDYSPSAFCRSPTVGAQPR
jgi:hypothetical protein